MTKKRVLFFVLVLCLSGNLPMMVRADESNLWKYFTKFVAIELGLQVLGKLPIPVLIATAKYLWNFNEMKLEELGSHYKEFAESVALCKTALRILPVENCSGEKDALCALLKEIEADFGDLEKIDKKFKSFQANVSPRLLLLRNSLEKTAPYWLVENEGAPPGIRLLESSNPNVPAIKNQVKKVFCEWGPIIRGEEPPFAITRDVLFTGFGAGILTIFCMWVFSPLGFRH